MPVFIILAGLFSFICAIKDVSWFFNNYKARRFVDTFGYKTTKVIYVVIGLFLMVIGVVALVL
ncbi:MAG: hypothetical protein E7509_05025 [Ruminococcus sp.]|nr:hypothetical protein [Ruminococcus sp.]